MVYELIDRVPNVIEILPTLGKNIVPSSWGGSRADIIVDRAKILPEMFSHPNEVVSSWAKARYDEVLRIAEQDRGREAIRDKVHNETFE